MIQQKENDWVLNLLGNSDLSVPDLYAAGLNADNTSLQDEKTYKASPKISQNPNFLKQDGSFDDTKFHNFYQDALVKYKTLANDTVREQQKKAAIIYGKDDIFAPKNQRRTFADTVQYGKTANPDRQTTSLIRIGETTAPKWSVSEIAQSQKVLANPVEAAKDWTKAIWHDSPNDSWFTDFFDTRVLAQWDSDGEHIDPVSGEKVKHKKGEMKLNENGTYFYENLDGRDVYGRQVLNKMNTLTTDGSKWNKYDFFDSDGLEEKSVGASILKNAALVGTMFIPYVGPWVAGLSVASQAVGLMGTLGKMLTGSDSPTFSAMEGWSKSVNRQTAKSQYAQENTWCWENFIDLIGDCAGQLKEQRFIFEYSPALVKGGKLVGWKGIDMAKKDKLIAEEAAKLSEINQAKIAKLGTLSADEAAAASALKASEPIQAKAAVEDFLENYNKLGGAISKGYMTAITVADTYGEAKDEGGASDIEATLLTMGYAALELKLLNSELGEWILPELKSSGIRNRKLIQAFTETPADKRLAGEGLRQATNGSKKELAKYWFNKGKQIAQESYHEAKTLKTLGGMTLSGALGEGFEETAEELLADFSKSCYNAVQWLQGDQGRMNAWDNMFDRYSMSFLGGAVGGGLTAAGTNFKTVKENYTPEQAQQELIYMLRHKKKDELYKTLDKMNLNTPYLSNDYELLSDGSYVEKPGTKDNNKDSDIKQAFRNQVEMLDDIIKSEGLNLPDNSILDKQTFNDIKLSVLQNSPISRLFIQDFNTLASEIARVQTEIKSIYDSKGDTEAKKQFTQAEQDKLNKLNQELLTLRAKKDSYLNGDMAMDYISKSLFDLTPTLRTNFLDVPYFKDFVKQRTGKDAKDLSNEELNEQKEAYNKWKETEYPNQVSILAPLYLDWARKSGMFIQEFAKNYDAARKNKTLMAMVQQRQRVAETLETAQAVSEESWLNIFAATMADTDADTLAAMVQQKAPDGVKQQLDALIKQKASIKDDTNAQHKLANQIYDLLCTEVAAHLDNYYDDFINLGAINPEIKHGLSVSIDLLGNKLKLMRDQHSKLSTLAYITNNLLMQNEDSQLGAFQILERDPDTGEPTKYDWGNKNVKLSELRQEVEDMEPENLGMWAPVDTMLDQLETLGWLPKTKEDITIDDYLKLTKQFDSVEAAFNQKKAAIENAPYTDTVRYIQQFIQANSSSNLDLPKLLKELNGIITEGADNISDVQISGYADQITDAIQAIKFLKGMTLGAQTDTNGNLGNLAGYNKTLNEVAQKHGVQNYVPLPEIDSNSAQVIVQDLDLIANKLEQARTLMRLNQGKKMTAQNKAAVNKAFIIYNRLKKFVDAGGDQWEPVAQALDKATIHKQYAAGREYDKLTAEQKEQIQSEVRDIEDAVYKLFQDNPDLIKNGDLKDLFKSQIAFYTKESHNLDQDTEVLDDRDFFSWLASRAALKHSDFYHAFNKRVDPANKRAPIATQEEAIYQAVAFKLNGQVFEELRKQYVDAAKEFWESLSDDRRKEIAKNLAGFSADEIDQAKDPTWYTKSGCLPKYSHIFNIEGVAGAGKSDAVDYFIYQILKDVDPSITQNAWIIHRTEESGKSLAKNIDAADASIYDHDKFMTKIYHDYDPNRPRNKKGEYIYTEDEMYEDELGDLHYKAEPDAISDIPSMIFIDEVSHFDENELELVNKFAKQHGIVVITSGDFNQSGKTATTTNSKGDYSLTLARSLFMGAPKLGISMRVASKQLDNSINTFNTLTKSGSWDIYHYENDETGLLGIKAVGSEAGVAYNDKFKNAMRPTIDRMVATSQNKEGKFSKIGLIYNDENSALVKLIKDEYADKFELFKGSAAQGLEGMYYVVDATGIPRATTGKKDMYTAITRASKGVLLYDPTNSWKSVNHIDNYTYSTGFTETEIKNYTEKRKKIFDSLYGTGEDLKFIPRTNEDGEAVIPPEVKVPDGTGMPAASTKHKWPDNTEVMSVTVDDITYETDGTDVYNTTDDSKVEGDVADDVLYRWNEEHKDSHEILPPDPTTEDTTGTTAISTTTYPPLTSASEDINDPDFTYLMHSHNTFELGYAVNDKGDVVYLGDDIDRYKFRIDSGVGLIKILESDWKHPKQKALYYEKALGDIRGILFNSKDNATIIKRLQRASVLKGLTKGHQVKSIEYGLMSVTQGTDGWGYESSNMYGMLDRHSDEHTVNNNNPSDPGNSDINRKTIGATIHMEDGKKLYIPLFVLGNLKTYIKNPQSALSKALADIWQKTVAAYPTKENPVREFHLNVVNDTEHKLPQHIKNLAKMWTYTSAGYFKIDNPNWCPMQSMQNYGVQINMDANSGGHFIYDKKENMFRPIKEFLRESGYNYSKQIYTSNHGTIALAGGGSVEFSHAGHPYILISTDPSFNTDEALIKQYKKQLADPNEPKTVTLCYVMPPKLEVEDYLHNLHKTFFNKSAGDQQLGSRMSSYFIWRALVNSGEITTDLNDSSKIYVAEETLKTIKSWIAANEDAYNNKDFQRIKDNFLAKYDDSHSVADWFNLQLIDLYKGVGTNEFKADKAKQIADIVKANGTPYLINSARFKNKESSTEVYAIPLMSDQSSTGESLFTTDGKEWTINAKIDSNLFAVKRDFDGVINDLADKIQDPDDKHPTQWSKDTAEYVGDTKKAPAEKKGSSAGGTFSGGSRAYGSENSYTIGSGKVMTLGQSITETNGTKSTKYYMKDDAGNMHYMDEHTYDFLTKPGDYKAGLANKVYPNNVEAIYNAQAEAYTEAITHDMNPTQTNKLLIQKVMDVFNDANSKTKNYLYLPTFSSGSDVSCIVTKTFMQDELKKVGLTELPAINVSKIEWNTDGSCKQPIDLGEGRMLTLNRATGDASITQVKEGTPATNVGLDTPIGPERYAKLQQVETPINEKQSKALNKFLDIISNADMTYSDIKEDIRLTTRVKERLKEINNPDINELLKMLEQEDVNDEVESCSITINAGFLGI